MGSNALAVFDMKTLAHKCYYEVNQLEQNQLNQATSEN